MAFDWKSIGESIAKIGLPLLGAALPLPGGSALGAALASAIGSHSTNPQDLLSILTSNAEALQKAKEFEATNNIAILNAVLNFQTQEEQTQGTVIQAEEKGESWLQRNWRPLMMIWFGVLLGLYWFGIQPQNMSNDVILSLFGLLKIGIGGYIGGRSAEKIAKSAPSIIAAMKS